MDNTGERVYPSHGISFKSVRRDIDMRTLIDTCGGSAGARSDYEKDAS